MAKPKDPVPALLEAFREHSDLVARVLKDEAFQEAAAECTRRVTEALTSGRRVLLCGNGGSAADAQHIAAEFTGHFREERDPLPVTALTTNTSSLTAIGNDYGYDHVFERQVRAYGRAGDVLVALSTSGNSPNCLLAVEAAKKLGLSTVAWTGAKGGKLASLADVCVRVPSDATPRIQEVHITLGHALAQAVDDVVLGKRAVASAKR